MALKSFSTAFSRDWNSFEQEYVPSPPCQHVTVSLPGMEEYLTLGLYGPQNATVQLPGSQRITLIVEECENGGQVNQSGNQPARRQAVLSDA